MRAACTGCLLHGGLPLAATRCRSSSRTACRRWCTTTGSWCWRRGLAKARIVEQHLETPKEQALREWFAKQALASPGTVEAAARTIIGLVTGLLSILFGVLAVAGDPLPSYLWTPWVRPLGVTVVVTLLIALICALVVVLPRKVAVSHHQPEEQAKARQALLARKSRWLKVAIVAFGAGLVALGAVVIVALLRVV